MQHFTSELISILREAERIAVLTGAGISAESGVPTFREAQVGLWARFNPEELATPEAFQRDPRLVWEWYAWRRELVLKAQPNPGHFALAKMEEINPSLTLITQNVDGLHKRAGSRSVIELHGNIFRTKCFEENRLVDSWQENGEMPPHCPQCGGMLRPDVVWFGEPLPPQALEDGVNAARSSHVFLSVGTSGIVHPAASLPQYAFEQGAAVIEVNPDDTPLSLRATFHLRGKAGDILPALVREVWKA